MDRTYWFQLRKAVQAVTLSGTGRKPGPDRRAEYFRRAGSGRYLSGVALLALAACSSGNNGVSPTVSVQRNVAVLLPLTGPNAVLGNEMLSAARLALSRPAGSTTLKATTSLPQVDAHDTAGPGGAAGAAQAAIAAGDGIILGPLTSPDTSLIAPAALQASVPVIAFTSDANQKRPGVWVFGITPQQQVDRLVAAGVAEGRHQFAAFLPDNPLGHALGDALIQSCHAKGLADPLIAYHVNTPEAISAGLATLSAYDSRVAAASGQATGSASDLPPDLAAALSSAPKADSVAPSDGNTASANKQITGGEAGNAATAASQALSAPPFDALLLGDLGLSLKNVIDGLKTNQISGSQVRLMGPGLWSAFSLKLGSIGGAWYAAPDPSDRKVFVQNFTTQMHRAPKPLADLAYDAGALAGSVSASSGGKGYPVDIMTRSQGFTGVDGLFTLLPDGSTTRDLAIFEIQAGGGARIIATQSTRGPSAPDAI